MASRIREMKDVIVSQNSALATLQREKSEVSEALKTLYTALVKYKVKHTTEAVTVENTGYPDIRSEDLLALSKTEIINRIGSAFSTLVASVTELRVEVHDVYHELDSDVESAIDTWRQLSSQGISKDKMHSFREDTLSNAAIRRAQTPEPLPAIKTDQAVNDTLPPTPPSSSHKDDSKGQKVDQPKSHAVKLGTITSPSKTSGFKSNTSKK